MSPELIVIGSGGHARVFIAALKAAGTIPLTCLDSDVGRWNAQVLGITVSGDDDRLPSLGGPERLVLVNGVGFGGRVAAPHAVWEKFSRAGYRFATVRDPRAVINEGVTVDEGAQILAGATVQPRTRIGSHAIVNTGACIDHDCVIAPHAHIAPGAVLCGDVAVGEGSHVGAGAVVRQGIRIGAGVVVAIGAVVISDVEDRAVVGGTPARPLRAWGAK